MHINCWSLLVKHREYRVQPETRNVRDSGQTVDWHGDLFPRTTLAVRNGTMISDGLAYLFTRSPSSMLCESLVSHCDRALPRQALQLDCGVTGNHDRVCSGARTRQGHAVISKAYL